MSTRLNRLLNRVQHWLAREPRRPGTRARRTCLSVEPLENRLVPTVFNVNSLSDLSIAGGVDVATGRILGQGNTVTLRSAIQAANATPGGNTINLTVPGVYSIALRGTPGETDNKAGEFAILPTGGDLTIQNASVGKIAIDAGGQSRVFDINPNFNAANPTAAFKVTLQGFTIENGFATDAANPDGPNASGGGVRDQGNASLTLNSVIVAHNTATADGGGVSMENVASVPWTLTVLNSTVTGNHAGDAGGGLETDGSGKVFVTGSIISDNVSVNQGAGIWLDAIAVTAQGGTVFQGANLTVTGTLLTGNMAVGAENAGGGIGNAGNGTVTIVSSTLANNFSGQFGGGFGDQNNAGTLVVVDSTFVDNVAVGNGGGIEAAGPSTTIADSTIAGNVSQAQGGGVAVASAAFTLNNTVIAGNLVNNNGGMNFQGTAPDIIAAVTTGSGDFIGIGDTNLTGITNGTQGNHVGTAAAPLLALLGPLQNNGGLTPTEAPLPGSPLIAAGLTWVVPAGTTLDQRGFGRTINATVDIGAVESQPAPVVVAEFGNTGVWQYNRAINSWTQLTAANASLLAADPAGDVVGEFPGFGVWRFTPAVGWQQINGVNATQLAMDARGEVFAEFPGYGVGEYLPGAGWISLTRADAKVLAVDPQGDVAGVFPHNGVWLFTSAAGWKQINGVDATLLAVDGNGDVVANFTGYGVGEYLPATGWQTINGVNASALTVNAAGEVLADFGAAGVGEYLPGVGWSQLLPAAAGLLAIDVNGDVFAEFAGFGLWEFDPSQAGHHIRDTDATVLAVA